MKKFFYTLAVVLFASVAMISCADDEVKVKENMASGSPSIKSF
jgi:hypothetical protein